MKIHESSPGGASSTKLKIECKNYLGTQYFLDVTLGASKNGIRCENLEHLTFENDSFDLVITQDVFEHVMDPRKAFSEVARILKPGGAHIFTVPYYCSTKTMIRAVESPEGVKFVAEKIYHRNPIDCKGSLVVTEWGNDLVECIYAVTGMITTIYKIRDRRLGLDGEFLEVFVSRKVGDGSR